MEQQIGFCTASDGVGIAYATLGEGPPLVYVNGWPGNLAVEWEKPFARAFLERLAEGLTLVRYDMRGSGLSDRVPGLDFSAPTLLKDLEAVVDHLGLERFPLLSLGFLAGPLAITYAAQHPDRVSSLVMYGPYANGNEISTPERMRAMIDYTRIFGLPDSVSDLDANDLDKWRDVFAIRKASAENEAQAELITEMVTIDVTPLLDKITVPVLIMHGRGDSVIPFALGRSLAARLSHAEFIPTQGGSAPWKEQEVIAPLIHRFLGVEERAAPAEPPVSPGAAPLTILFTDIESSTALTQRLGDEKAQELVRTHDAIVRQALTAHGGSETKHTGDGIMASFVSASRALECALAIQRAVAARAEEQSDAPLAVHIGLNAGEPVAEERDLFGTAVQLARRICDHASAGEVLVSDVVRQLVAGKGFLFAERGEVALRGFEDPVRLYEVRWREA